MSFRHDNAIAQTKFRLAALENGYTPLPNHHKHCYLKGWGKVKPTPEMIEGWQRKLAYQATGLRVENGLCAMDIDIDDAELVERLWNRANSRYPQLREALVRFGSGAKEAWFCRVDETFSVIHSTGHVKPGVDPEAEGAPMYRFEAFGGDHVRQMGAFGAHTMRADNQGFLVEYTWMDDESPADVRLDALPLVPKAAVLAIAEMASEELAAADWPRLTRTKTGESALAAVYDLEDGMRFDCLDGHTRSLAELKDYAATAKDARCSASWMGDAKYVNRTRCLVSLDHDGHVSVLETANWTRHLPVGLADAARPLSEKMTDLKERMQEQGYDFDHDAYPDAPISFQDRVLHLLDNWAWCGARTNPCLPIFRPERMAMTVGNFRLTEITYAYEQEGPKGGVKKISPVEAWLNHAGRRDVDGYQFLPGLPPGVHASPSDGTLHINSYKAPKHVPVSPEEYEGHAALWEDFLKHLLPRSDEREWFMDWLAYKKQNPAIPGVGVIMYAGEFGVGRGSLFEIIGGVFGDEYVNSIGADTLMGASTQSQYTDWMTNALFVTTDEVLPEGDDGTSMTWRRKKAYEKLKERIDPKPRRAEIVRKGLPNYQDWVCATFLLATNHDNAVPIPKGDRRLTVLTNSTIPLAMRTELMSRLNAIRNPSLDRTFASSVAKWLDARDVSAFNMQVAPEFDGKRAMQEANVTELEGVVDDIMLNLPYDWVTLDAALDRVNAALIRQDIRDDFPAWRKTATDRIKSAWVGCGRHRVEASNDNKRLVLARSRDAEKAMRALRPEERHEQYRVMCKLDAEPSAKLRALRAGLREV